MSRPFALTIADRARDPERVVRETLARMEKWKNLSGKTMVTLDEVTWLGAVLYLGGIEAGKMQQEQKVAISHKFENDVHSIVATDETPTHDSAGG